MSDIIKLDLFAGADDNERLKLARQNLIDLSISELLEIRARARADIERVLENESNPKKRARLQALLGESKIWTATRALAAAMLDKQRKVN